MTEQETPTRKPLLSEGEIDALVASVASATDAPPGAYQITEDDWAEAMADAEKTASPESVARPQLTIGELLPLFRHRLHDARNSEEFHRGQATAYFEVVNALERLIVEHNASTGDGK